MISVHRGAARQVYMAGGRAGFRGKALGCEALLSPL